MDHGPHELTPWLLKFVALDLDIGIISTQFSGSRLAMGSIRLTCLISLRFIGTMRSVQRGVRFVLRRYQVAARCLKQVLEQSRLHFSAAYDCLHASLFVITISLVDLMMESPIAAC
jgi:hypothetical protein